MKCRKTFQSVTHASQQHHRRFHRQTSSNITDTSSPLRVIVDIPAHEAHRSSTNVSEPYGSGLGCSPKVPTIRPDLRRLEVPMIASHLGHVARRRRESIRARIMRSVATKTPHKTSTAPRQYSNGTIGLVPTTEGFYDTASHRSQSTS